LQDALLQEVFSRNFIRRFFEIAQPMESLSPPTTQNNSAIKFVYYHWKRAIAITRIPQPALEDRDI
jgi:hypothetical protein